LCPFPGQSFIFLKGVGFFFSKGRGPFSELALAGDFQELTQQNNPELPYRSVAFWLLPDIKQDFFRPVLN